MLYYMAVIREYFECGKYKKLYLEEKQKHEELRELVKEYPEISARGNYSIKNEFGHKLIKLLENDGGKIW